MVDPHMFRNEQSVTRTTNSMYGEYYSKMRGQKIRCQPILVPLLQYVDLHSDEYIAELAEIIRIPSITFASERKNDAMEAIHWAEKWLKKLGLKHECYHLFDRTDDGQNIELSPIILANTHRQSHKKTIGIYANLDVLESDKNEWKTDPFNLVEINKKLYGCGTASGKSALMCWFLVIHTFNQTKTELPVNLKVVIESMHHDGHRGLPEFLGKMKIHFFYDIDTMVVCDGEWLGEKQPCLIYAGVGIIHADIHVEKNEKFSKNIYEEMQKITDRIIDDKGKILIPKFNDLVEQVTPDEELIYESIKDIDMENIRKNLPEHKKSWSLMRLLMDFWRFPAALVSDIEECNCDKNDKTKIRRHFIFKIVPKQILEQSCDLIIRHVENVVKEMQIRNAIKCKISSTVHTWYEDLRAPHYMAARKAILQIYKEDPTPIREDRSRILITMLQRILKTPILLLPIIGKNSHKNEPNENISRRNFIETIKLLQAFLFQFSTN